MIARPARRLPCADALRGVLLAIALVLASLVPFGTSVSAQEQSGSVRGHVVNKTQGGSSIAGVNVTLVTFGRREQAPLGQQSVRADAEGRYEFSGLNRDPNLVYIVAVRFQGATYPSSSPFTLEEQTSVQADVQVYDATTADDAIQFERVNMLVLGADQGVLQMMQMGAVVNTGDRTFVTANPQDQALARALKFALPRGAMGAQMQTGFNNQDLIGGQGGVQITSPVPPGRHEFALSFQVPYSGTSADLTLQLPYPTGTYNVYVPATGLRLESGGLNASGTAQLGGQSYALYTASNLARASMVPSQITGLGGTGVLAPNQLAWISLAVVLVILGGGALVLGFRGRRPRARADGTAVDLEQERLELVVRLAALDERFAAGSVTPNEYEAERARGKQRLRELVLAQRAGTTSSP